MGALLPLPYPVPPPATGYHAGNRLAPRQEAS